MCILMWISLWLLMWKNLFCVSMCSNWVCNGSGMLLILLRNSVFLLVCLKWLIWWCCVLVKVLVLWLNNLFFSSLDGIVVVLSVMNGFCVCGDL